MKESILSIALVVMLFSCSQVQTLDLSNVDFGKSSKDYRLGDLSPSGLTEQNGHYEVVYDTPLSGSSTDNGSLVIKDNGERLANFQFDDAKSNSHLNYAGLPLDASYGTRIVDYNGNISFISTSIDRTKTIELIAALEKNIGKATEIINNETMEENLKSKNINLLITALPDNTKKMQDDLGNDIISYAERLVWNKSNQLYILTLNPVGEDITNTLTVISKKAFKDKVILGFHVPDKDPILSKYLQ